MHSSNPLLTPWNNPFGLPPFGAIRSEDFRPAFEAALAAHKAEIDAIAANAAPPTFGNTIEALERAGKTLTDVGSVFWNLTATDTNAELQAIERDMAAALSRHSSDISMNEALFRRVDALYEERRTLALTPEQLRVLELTHRNFVRAGAKLDAAGKARLKSIMERLATLSTRFSQNVLADESSWLLLLEAADLDGLSEDFRAAAARLAQERGAPGKYAVSLSRSSAEPFLQSSARRDLRETVYRAWTRRGENGGETDNTDVIREILALREERAKLLGFTSFAAYKLDDTMAKTPAAVRDLLDRVIAPARARAAEERANIQARVDAEGANFEVAGHDWRYYAERVRKDFYDLDQATLRPYFQLDKMIEAAFHVAGRLFGVRFVEREGLDLYHPDVRAFEVVDRDGRHVALFLGDYFARPSKRSGAWMSDFRSQQKLDGDVRPIIVNVMNFTRGAADAPTLLSLDDARTLFHEFGHALHGMLSDVTYPLVSGTNVARDFVELPSQLFEHWLLEPVILKQFARHAETGAPMPDLRLRPCRSRHSRAELSAGHGSRRVRKGKSRENLHAARNRHAAQASPLQPYLLGRRLLGGLLQLSLGRDARRRRLRGLQGNGRPLSPGSRRETQEPRLRGGRQTGRRRRLCRLSRSNADRRAASPTTGFSGRDALTALEKRKACAVCAGLGRSRVGGFIPSQADRNVD